MAKPMILLPDALSPMSYRASFAGSIGAAAILAAGPDAARTCSRE
jgi:hypothetical protein